MHDPLAHASGSTRPIRCNGTWIGPPALVGRQPGHPYCCVPFFAHRNTAQQGQERRQMQEHLGQRGPSHQIKLDFRRHLPGLPSPGTWWARLIGCVALLVRGSGVRSRRGSGDPLGANLTLGLARKGVLGPMYQGLGPLICSRGKSRSSPTAYRTISCQVLRGAPNVC